MSRCNPSARGEFQKEMKAPLFRCRSSSVSYVDRATESAPSPLNSFEGRANEEEESTFIITQSGKVRKLSFTSHLVEFLRHHSTGTKN